MNEAGVLRADMDDKGGLDPHRAVDGRNGGATADSRDFRHRQKPIPNRRNHDDKRRQNPNQALRWRQLQGGELLHVSRALVGKFQVASESAVPFGQGHILPVGQTEQATPDIE